MKRQNDKTTAFGQAATTRALQSAYSHYGNVMHVSSGDTKSASGMKRVFTAALLSTASFVAVGSAQAACTGSGTSIVCSGAITSQQEFSSESAVTVTVEAGTVLNTYGEASTNGSNAGIDVNVMGLESAYAAIINSGDITTAQLPGDEYGNHHGLHAYGTYGASITNNEIGAVTTYDYNSLGLFAESPVGYAMAENLGSVTTHGERSDAIFVSSGYSADARNSGFITTYGSYSAAVHATSYGAATASNSEDGVINVLGAGADGVVAMSASSEATVRAHNSGAIILSGGSAEFSPSNWLNEYGPDIAQANEGQVLGVAAIGTFATALNYAHGSIALIEDGSVGLAASGVGSAQANNYGSITVGRVDSEDGFNLGIVAFSEDGDATATNSGDVAVFGQHSAGLLAYSAYNGDAVATNVSGTVFIGSSEVSSEDGGTSIGVLAVSNNGSAKATNGVAENSEGSATIETFGANDMGVVAFTFNGGASVIQESGVGHLGGAVAANFQNGSIITHGDNSFAVAAMAMTDKFAVAYNAGTIETYGSGAHGVVATGAGFTFVNEPIVNELNPLLRNSVNPFSDADLYSVMAAANAGTITTHGDRSAGVLASSKYASAGVQNAGDITTGGDYAVALSSVSKYGNAFVVNEGTLSTEGRQSSGIYAHTKYSDVIVNNEASGVISTTGFGANGIQASTNGMSINKYFDGSSYVHVVNDGSITTTGDYSSGITAASPTAVTVENTGTINVSGDHSAGIFAQSAGSASVVSVNNSGSVIASGYDSTGIVAWGPRATVTNEVTGVINGTYSSDYFGQAISVTSEFNESEGSGTGTVINYGRIIGSVEVHGDIAAHVTNTGSIDGDVYAGTNSYDLASVTIVNNGGTVTGGVFTRGNADISISGIGNSIGRGIHGSNANEDGFTSLAFNHTDTVTFANGIDGAAISGVNEISFNSGTTIFDTTENGANIAGAAYGTSITVGGGDTQASLRFVGEAYADAASTVVLNHGGLGTAVDSSVMFSGDVGFARGGRLNVEMGAGNTGLVTASTINFAEGAYVNVNVLSGADLRDGATTVVALGDGAGSVTVADGVGVGGMRVTDNTILFDFLTAQNATASDLELVTKRALLLEQLERDQNGSANYVSVAAALDLFIKNQPNDNPIVIYLSQFDTPEAQQAALLQLVQNTLPEENNSTAQSTLTATDLVFNLIMDRLSSGGRKLAANASGRTGLSAGDIALGGDGGWAIWGQAGAARSEFTPSTVNGFDANVWGITLGMDGNVGENTRAGLAFFHQKANVDETGAGANSGTDIKGTGGLVYMSYRPAPWYVDGALGYSFNEYDNNRRSLGGLNQASYDGSQFVARLEVGHDFISNGWTITPNAGLRYSHVKMDGYTETGPLPIAVRGSSFDSLRGVAGLNVSYRQELENGGLLIPEASVELINEFANPSKAITASVIGGGTFLTVPNARKDLSFGASAGVTYEASDAVSVRLMYKGEFGKDYVDNGLQLAVRFAF